MNASEWLPLRYRDFHDVPRLLAVELDGVAYLLDCPFDDTVDEYLSEYTVYRLPDSVKPRLADASWLELPSLGTEVGRVPVGEIEFDPSRREAIAASSLRRFAA